MNTDTITFAHVALLATVTASVFAVLNIGLRWLMEYLSARLGVNNARDRREAEIRQTQSEQCRFDHSNVTAILTAQNATMAKSLEQNGRMLDAMKEATHVSELRHQIILSKLERIDDRIHAVKGGGAE